MSKVAPEYLPRQNEAQQELIQSLISLRAGYNEAVANKEIEKAEALYKKYVQAKEEIKLNHPEFIHSQIDQWLIDTSNKLNRIYLDPKN